MPTKARTASKKRSSKPASSKKKTAVKKRTTKKRAKPVVHDVKDALPAVPSVCRGCHALPAGSVELVSLLLVLIFSLSAVLFTSVYALEKSQSQLEAMSGEAGPGSAGQTQAAE